MDVINNSELRSLLTKKEGAYCLIIFNLNFERTDMITRISCFWKVQNVR